MPEVVADPQGEVSRTFQELGVCVVQQCAKIRQQGTFCLFVCFSFQLLIQAKFIGRKKTDFSSIQEFLLIIHAIQASF